MPGHRNDAQWRDQQSDDGEQRDFEEQRQRDWQTDAEQAFYCRPVGPRAAAFVWQNIALRRGALRVPTHRQEHKPVNAAGRHAATYATQFRHAEFTVDKDVVDRDIHQQAEEANHHARLGFR
ncbi:hypothetical protein D3C72_947560 [compost metagenome]